MNIMKKRNSKYDKVKYVYGGGMFDEDNQSRINGTVIRDEETLT